MLPALGHGPLLYMCYSTMNTVQYDNPGIYNVTIPSTSLKSLAYYNSFENKISNKTNTSAKREGREPQARSASREGERTARAA